MSWEDDFSEIKVTAAVPAHTAWPSPASTPRSWTRRVSALAAGVGLTIAGVALMHAVSWGASLLGSPASDSVAVTTATAGTRAVVTAARDAADPMRVVEAAGPATADAVQQYLTARHRTLLAALEGTLTGDGTTQLVLSGAGTGCASCHTRWITVWDVSRGEALWETDDGADTVIALAADGSGFDRTDSVRLEGEPWCCPSQRVTQTLIWDGATFVPRPAF